MGEGLTPADYAHSESGQRLAAVLLKSERPYSVIVTNPDEVRKFLRTYEIAFDRIWIPNRADIDGLDHVLASFLEDRLDRVWSINGPTANTCRVILIEYGKQFSGFVDGGTRYVICCMVLPDVSEPPPPENVFLDRHIADSGCLVVRVIFNADARTLVDIECNGNG